MQGGPIKRERVSTILVAAFRRPFDLLQRSMQVLRASCRSGPWGSCALELPPSVPLYGL